MRFTEITIHTNTFGAEIVGGVLTAAGIACYSIEDPADLAELLESGKIPYDYVDDELLGKTGGETLVKVYLTPDSEGKAQISKIREGVAAITVGDCGSLKVDEREVDDDDWADNWKAFFHPLPIGERFMVCPTWESCDPAGRTVLTIDPGSSFGTGRHETTALCLKLLEKVKTSGEDVLDMGCGSGILAVGALKLGAKSALLVDNDRAAVVSAKENLVQNGVAEKSETLCGNVLEDEDFAKDVFGRKYGVILANIVADIIIAMARQFFSALETGGALICSGIIECRCAEVKMALQSAGFSELHTEYDNGWAAILCTKK